jgi:excisionase family DNA binding protein
MFSTEFIDVIADAVAEKVIARLAAQEGGSKPKRLMTVAAAATYIGRSTQATYHLISQNRIPHRRQGSRVFFDRQELDKWIAELEN